MDCISESDLKYILSSTNKILDEGLLNGPNIFITGATGFFGKWLLETFIYLNNELNLNIDICALSRNPEKFLENFPHYKNEKCLTWIKGDIRSFKFPKDRYDYIIHAATDADAKLNSENPLLMLDTITEGTKRILELAKSQTGLKALLITSSGAVYGKQSLEVYNIKETDFFSIDIADTDSAYAEGKRISELYCLIYAKQYNIPVKIARCFAFVGPYLPLDKHFAIGNFIMDGLNGKDIIIKGDGLSIRSYMYASDLVIWLLNILLSGENGEAYNVGSDKSISIKDLALKVASFFPGISVVIQNQLPSSKGSVNYVPDVSKFKERYNLMQEIDLGMAIKKTISHYKKK